jgi:osmoprotectant transport system permease protein
VLGVVCAGLVAASTAAASGNAVVVGSKAFPESWILGAAVERLAREGDAAPVTHRSNLGGTEIVFQALRSGDVDVYPEYTGTIAEVIAHTPGAALPALRDSLRPLGIEISEPLGFDDSYALAVTRATAARSASRGCPISPRTPSCGSASRTSSSGVTTAGARSRAPMASRRGRSQGSSTSSRTARSRAAASTSPTSTRRTRRSSGSGSSRSRTTAASSRATTRCCSIAPISRDRAPRSLAAMLRLTGRVTQQAMIRANARVVLGQQPFAAAADSLLLETLGAAHAAPRPARITPQAA